MLKRGFEHIEVIVGFAIFIIFLVFGLYFFNPLDTTRVLDSTLYYATDAIMDNVTTPLEVHTLDIDDSIADDVVVSVIVMRDEATGEGVRVENEQGRVLEPFAYSSGKLSFDHQTSQFITVKFGSFPYTGEGSINTAQDISELYQLASFDTRQVVSEQLFLGLRDNYNANYDQLRTRFNLPRRTSFAFSLHFSEQEMIQPTYGVPESVQVFSDTKRVEVIRTDGSTAFADLLVLTW